MAKRLKSRTCGQCGKTFKPKKVGTSGKPSRYCSPVCRVAGEPQAAADGDRRRT